MDMNGKIVETNAKMNIYELYKKVQRYKQMNKEMKDIESLFFFLKEH